MRRLTTTTKNALRQIRHTRIRARVLGTKTCPRLSVFRSLKHITAQLVDDTAGRTICYVDSKNLKADAKGKTAPGFAVGKLLAAKAKEQGITQAVFDRGGYKYHGRVRAVADGAREGGLKF